jgi:cell division protein FtsZ
LLTVLGKGASLLDAFKAANDVLLGAVQGISELITRPGLINVDFADVRTVMSAMGTAMMGTGRASGERRAQQAAEAAVASPLLDNIDLAAAQGLLVNVTAGMDISIGEFEEVGNTIKDLASDGATVVVGAVIDPDIKDELRVTIVATGIGRAAQMGAGEEAVAPVRLVRRSVSAVNQGGRRFDRAAARLQAAASENVAVSSEEDMEYLDVPAFLRRQAN